MAKFCAEMGMQLSIVKTLVLSTGPIGRAWRVGNSDDYLEEFLVTIYLGVNVQFQGQHTLRREKDIISIARRYAYSIFSLTRAGLD